MKLASGFCIPEPLPVHTGIKGRQVHPLIRFKPLFLSPWNRKGFRPSVKDSFRSFLFVVTAVVMAGKRAFHRRALRRPHPARREVTCGDTDMDWPRLGAVLHTTRLWGRSYLGVGRRAASRT